MKQTFLHIIDNRDNSVLVPFLQKLTEKERRGLVPVIRKEDKKYESYEVRTQPGVWDKVELLRIARFICYGTADMKGIHSWDLPEPKDMDKILEWYCPPWFSDIVNNEEYFHERTYKRVAYWQSRGFVDPQPQMIANTLDHAIVSRKASSNEHIYSVEELEKYPVTLDEHIWYFFEYPSNIEWADKWRCDNVDHEKSKGNWCDTFIMYTQNGRLDRMRVLCESLLAVNRNFNKVQTGWFMTLFTAMEPTPEELISLQDELFAALNCMHSKPANITLNFFKKLYTHSQFKADNLLPYLPILLNSEVKSIVQSSLTLVDGILKKNLLNREEVCGLTCSAFLSKDEAIQKKAANIIIKYAPVSAEIRESLTPFTENLLMSIKSLLKDYLTSAPEPSVHLAEEAGDDLIPIPPLIREENKLPEIQSFEDFAFFISQALDASEVYDLDKLMNGLVIWGNQVTEDTIVLLEPAFQKVFRKVTRWDIPLEGISLNLVFSYMEYLEKKYPGKLQRIHNDKEKMIKLEKERQKKHKIKSCLLTPFEKLNVSFHFTGFHQIGVFALQKMYKHETFPLLSTPTHAPTWIDPVTLVERLISYQKNKQDFHDMDLQLALQRCALDHTIAALHLAQKELKGEVKDMILFFLDSDAGPKGKYEHPAWWMTAGMTRSPGVRFPEFSSFKFNIPEDYLYVNHEWEVYTKHYMAYGSYNLQKKEYDRYPATRAALKTSTPRYTYVKQRHDLFMQYLFHVKLDHVDYLIQACPYLPDDIYGDTMLRLGEWSYTWEVAEQELCTLAITSMHALHTPFREMHYFLLAGSLLASHKTARDYAIQIWIERVSMDFIDSTRIGKAIGKMESLELAPLKRFTDVLSSHMIGISKCHNKAALEMVEAILPELSPAPIKNVKKLLEIYHELLALNHARTSLDKIPRLGDWVQENSLKKVIRQILND